MVETNIPPSVREILDEFIRYRFFKIPYKKLASALDKNVDTIIQRVRRNKDYFEIDDSERPSRISIKKGLKEVYFYRDKNICRICQKQVFPNELNMRYRNPYQKDKFEWDNVLSVCNECKNKKIVKMVKHVKKPSKIEYKEVHIEIKSKRNPKTDDWESYYVFDELDGSGSFPLLDEDEKIASKTVADVLNYYAADGWRVIHIEIPQETEYMDLEFYQVFFERERSEIDELNK